MNTVEVSGIGIIGPHSQNLDEFRHALYSQMPRSATMPNRTGDTPILGVDMAWNHGIPPRSARRLDRFAQLAIYAADQSLRACPVSAAVCSQKPSRVGLCIGNNYGGWSYVEPMMRPLYDTGMKAINPYVATAWFPAAAQGEISIRLGMKGVSKTFAVERLSSAYAVDYARLLIGHQNLDVVIAGGAEAPLSPAVLASMCNSGLLSSDVPAGEAACMLTLRQCTNSQYPQIAGMGKGRDPLFALKSAIQDAGLSAEEIGLVLLDTPRGTGDVRRRHIGRQLAAVTALRNQPLPAAQPLPFGETVGAAFSVQIAAACVALNEQRIPVSTFEPASREELETRGFPRACNTLTRLGAVAILGSDAHGQWMSAVITKRHRSGNGGNAYEQ